MSRLPTPGSDSGSWGEILNDFLSVSHDTDGALKEDSISHKAEDTAVVHLNGNESINGIKTFNVAPIIPTPTSSNEAINKSYADTQYPLKSITTATGAALDQQILWTINKDPIVADPNMFEVWTRSPSNVSFLGSWMNERGLWRGETKDTWESVFKAIIPTTQTGYPIQIERRANDNSRSIIGGFDANARPITSLQAWNIITPVDPNSTGKYSIASTDAFSSSDSIDSLAVRFDTNDVIRMRGQLATTATGTVNGDVLFNLPTEYRPSKSRTLGSATTGGALVTVQIRSNGQVVARRTISGPFNLSFDDLTYHL